MASVNFETYDRNLRRVYWAMFIDEQVKPNWRKDFRASLVSNSYTDHILADAAASVLEPLALAATPLDAATG